MRLVLNVSPTMTTEYRIEKFSVCLTSAVWWGLGIVGGGGEGGGSARCFHDVQVVCLMLCIFQFALNFVSNPISEGKRTNPPSWNSAYKENPTRRRRRRRDGKKLIIILRVPFNQLSYFFTVVNVIFSLPPIQCVPRRQRKRRRLYNDSITTTKTTTTNTTTTIATRHYI